MIDPLLKWSYIIFVISFALLFTLFYIYSPEEILIENLDSLESKEYFKIRGEIISVKDYEKVTYLTIAKSCEAELMIFKTDNISYIDVEGEYIFGEGHVLEKGTYVLDSFKIN